MDDINRRIENAFGFLNDELKQQPEERSKCTIYRVHRHLRDVNSSAYEPEVIAIGPYHRGKDHLKMMEVHKLYTLQLLVERKGGYIMERVKAVVGLKSSKARKCYADQDFILSKSEFIDMLILDGCFIVELVRKFDRRVHRHADQEWLREKDDPIFQMEWMLSSLRRDLMLFENQVPFFVLLDLFDLIKDPNENLVHLLSNFFSGLYPGGRWNLREVPLIHGGGREIMHLLDLIHRDWVPPRSQEPERMEFHVTRIVPGRVQNLITMKEKREIQFINCATRLTEANVKFEVKEEAATLFDIEFKDGVMVMAPLFIEDGTECVLRNLIAYEQYFQQSLNYFVTDYTMLLDSLINSSKDVEILSRNGIITNWQGDDEVVAKMVNRLGDSVICSGVNYAKIFKDVNEHCRKPRNKWMAKLRRDYMHSPWAIISIIAAVVLLLLTFVQTLFTILG